MRGLYYPLSGGMLFLELGTLCLSSPRFIPSDSWVKQRLTLPSDTAKKPFAFIKLVILR